MFNFDLQQQQQKPLKGGSSKQAYSLRDTVEITRSDKAKKSKNQKSMEGELIDPNSTCNGCMYGLLSQSEHDYYPSGCMFGMNYFDRATPDSSYDESYDESVDQGRQDPLWFHQAETLDTISDNSEPANEILFAPKKDAARRKEWQFAAENDVLSMSDMLISSQNHSRPRKRLFREENDSDSSLSESLISTQEAKKKKKKRDGNDNDFTPIVISDDGEKRKN